MKGEFVANDGTAGNIEQDQDPDASQFQHGLETEWIHKPDSQPQIDLVAIELDNFECAGCGW
ncbi:hypothetical protein RY831_04530 [Noviherbaspirillum sp. CPCC 100848]|uniref:Uncharacterized protein n=1 Tax=Noviherbaspirillum album TaxID=3080276 RepID=A0ABU6J458_9BURK|nr:hypothetical protein [Noviherbaspirillum sp. CPCC 100848]MEC4718399.1 hypothetical protein [Noviherbaspirillum sp. CPCC 100848]